jgi:hypothetical protein
MDCGIHQLRDLEKQLLHRLVAARLLADPGVLGIA